MSSNHKKKSTGGVKGSYIECPHNRKYSAAISSSSSSPIRKLVASPMETSPERKKLKWSDRVLEPNSVPSTIIKASSSDEDIEILVFDSSSSSSQSNDGASSTTTSSNLLSTPNRSSAITDATIEEFQRKLSYLKNIIGLPGAESTPNEDVTGNRINTIYGATSLEPTTVSTSKQKSDPTISNSVIKDSIATDSKLSSLIRSESSKQSSILKQSSSSKQSSPIPSKVQKMEITTQKVEPRTVELTISMPVNVNCKASMSNDSKSPKAVQTETKYEFKYESKKKLRHVKVSEDSSSSFKSSRMDSEFKHFDPNKNENKNRKIVTCPAFSKGEKRDTHAQLSSESNASSITEQFDKYLEKLHDIFKTKKIKSTVKKKYMKGLLEEICKIELSDESSTASDSKLPVCLNTEPTQWSKNISLTESKYQKYLEVLQEKILKRRDKNKIESILPTVSTQTYTKEKTTRSKSTKMFCSREENETPKTSKTVSNETYVLAPSYSSPSMDCLSKLPENERYDQLSWINAEINHLHKLKEKLETESKKYSRKRTKTNIYNVSKTDGSSGRTYIIKTDVDVLANENSNNYIFDGREYVVSHSLNLSSNSDQAIAPETVQCDGMGTFCKICQHIFCTCPSKTTLQSKLSSLCSDEWCLHCQRFVCICQETIDKSADSQICACSPRLVCICGEKDGVAMNSAAKVSSNKGIQAKLSVASKKESSKSLSSPKFASLNEEECLCLCKEPTELMKAKNLASESKSSNELLALAEACSCQETTQTREIDEVASPKDSIEAASLIGKIVNIVLSKISDKKNTQEKSPNKSSSTHAIRICDVALQTLKEVSCKCCQIETPTEAKQTDISLLIQALSQALKELFPQLGDNNLTNALSKMSEEFKERVDTENSREKLLDKSSLIKPRSNLGDTSKNLKYTHSFDENLPKDQTSSQALKETWPLTEQDLNSSAEISEFDDDEPESGLLLSEDNLLYSERFGFKDISDEQSELHDSKRIQICVRTRAKSIYEKDDNTGVCAPLCALKNPSILPQIKEDLKNDLAKMLEDLKKVDDDASIKPSPAIHEKSPEKSSTVLLKDPNRDVGVQGYPTPSTVTAQTSVEKLKYDKHTNTDSDKYEGGNVRIDQEFHLPSAETIDILKKDKNENTILQDTVPIRIPNTYKDIGVQVSQSFHSTTAQTLDKFKKDQNENTTLSIDRNTYRNIGVQVSPSFLTAAAQTLEEAKKDKNENTDNKGTDPSRYRNIGIPFYPRFHSTSAQTSDILKKDENENTDLQVPVPMKDPNTYRDIGVQVSSSFHTAAAQTLDKIKKDKNVNTDPKDAEPLKDPSRYRDIGVQVSPRADSPTAQNLEKFKNDRNDNIHLKSSVPLIDPNTYRNIGVEVSPSLYTAAAQTLDRARKNENGDTYPNDAEPFTGPNTYTDIGVQVSPSFHTPIDQPSVQESDMNEFESADNGNETPSIVTKETCPKCKKCERKKKHPRSRKTSGSTTTITTSVSDTTASPTSSTACSCCKRNTFLPDVNYIQNGNILWAVCNQCFYNRRLYCGYNCTSLCQCWSYWLNNSRICYSRRCKMDISTSTQRVQGLAYTVTLLNNNRPRLQEYPRSSLEDVIKVEKGWTPNHSKYLENREDDDRRQTQNIENKDKKKKDQKNKKISKTDITDKNKKVESNDKIQQSEFKNTSKTKIRDKAPKNKTSKTETEKENANNREENYENEDQDESSEIKSVQNTLMDYLIENRPEFISAAEYRRKMLLESKKSRERQREAMKLDFLKNYSKTPNKGKIKLFTEQEMRNINKKNYKKLPEVRGEKLNHRENKLRQADRLMSDLLAKKVQKSVLKGKARFPIDQSLTNL